MSTRSQFPSKDVKTPVAARVANAGILPNAAGPLLVTLFTLAFLLPWWNRYLGLTNEGWFHFYGLQVLRGRIPYRDFYSHVPPVQALTMAGLISIFGNRIVVGEIFGVIAALCIALSLQIWLQRILPASWSAIAVITGMAIYLNVSAETLSGVHLVSILYPVVAFTAASFALDRNRLLWVFASGFFAGISVMTKQTSGVAATFSVAAVLGTVFFGRKQEPFAQRAAVVFAIAWLVPVVPICLWLGAHGAFQAFLADVFLKGSSSKGSLGSLLIRQLVGISTDYYLKICAIVALGAVALFALLFDYDGRGDKSRTAAWESSALLTIGAGILCIVLVIATVRVTSFSPVVQRAAILFHNVPLFFGEFGSLVLLLRYCILFFRDRTNRQNQQYLLASAASFSCAYLSSFSWANAANILLPALPFVLAFSLSRLREKLPSTSVKLATLVGVLVCIATMSLQKLHSPYTWADWKEGDVRLATAHTNLAELRGITVSPEDNQFLNRVVADIQQNSRPSDPVAEFCCMPILYALANREPSTFSYVHYIDVTPDEIYVADAQRIEHSSPAVIVTLERSDDQLREDEIYFRGGRASGERELWRALTNLAPRYDLVDRLTAPITNKRVEVWARRDH